LNARFITGLEKEAARQKRKILLLIDNAPSHIFDTKQLEWVRIEELEPNMTSHIQPNDAGIIKAFKSQYRRLYIRNVVERDEAGVEDIWHINQLEAMQLAEEAWGVVSKSTISNCWRHTRIITPRGPDGVTLHPEQLQDPTIHTNSTIASVEKSIELLQRDLDKLIARRVGVANAITAAEMVDVEGENVTEMEWTDAELLDHARSELGLTSAATPDDDDEEAPIYTSAKALQSVKELLRYSERQSSKEWNELAKVLPKVARTLRLDVQESLHQSDLNTFIL